MYKTGYCAIASATWLRIYLLLYNEEEKKPSDTEKLSNEAQKRQNTLKALRESHTNC